MGARNTATGWGWVAKSFHWIIAALVLGMLALGWYIEDLREGGEADLATVFQLFAWHKSIGLTVLALVLLRLLWRVTGPLPAPAGPMPAWESLAASVTHWLLYFAILALPVSGYVIHAGFPFDSDFFGLAKIPKLFATPEPVREIAETVHGALALLVAGLTALHVAAALRHHFLKKDATLVRMLPFGSDRRA